MMVIITSFHKQQSFWANKSENPRQTVECITYSQWWSDNSLFTLNIHYFHKNCQCFFDETAENKTKML